MLYFSDLLSIQLQFELPVKVNIISRVVPDQPWYFTFGLSILMVCIYMCHSYSMSEATEGGHLRRLFECIFVRNIVTVTFRKMSFQLEFWKIANQLISRKPKGGRLNV